MLDYPKTLFIGFIGRSVVVERIKEEQNIPQVLLLLHEESMENGGVQIYHMNHIIYIVLYHPPILIQPLPHPRIP